MRPLAGNDSLRRLLVRPRANLTAAMPDQILQSLRANLNVKLQPEPTRMFERLNQTSIALRQMNTTLRKIIRLAMPVQNIRLLRNIAEKERTRCLIPPPDRKPSNLPNPVPIHTATQRIRQQLRTQTNTQNIFAALQAFRDQPLLRRQPRVFTLIMNAHRPAHHHEQIEIIRCRQVLTFE